jgi:hypothetical protein
MKKNPYPKCIVPKCRNRAARWDGGICGSIVNDDGKLAPGYIVWLCRRHDPNHKHFDLPEDPAAIADLVLLRETLQKLFVETYGMNTLRAEVSRWRRLYLDKPEDRLWHDSDQTWWLRRDDSYLGAGGLFRADPPKPIQKLLAENTRLRAQVKRLKKAP